MGLLPSTLPAQASGQSHPQAAAGSRLRLRDVHHNDLSSRSVPHISAAAAMQRQPQQCGALHRCRAAEEAGAPLAALSQDADADQKREEYNRRMQQQMGWEDANPYEYHYGALATQAQISPHATLYLHRCGRVHRR